jgi:hypothetical protein
MQSTCAHRHELLPAVLVCMHRLSRLTQSSLVELHTLHSLDDLLLY